MPRWIMPAAVALLVCARAAVFLIWPESYFDADQAVVGLMTKHLSELRAFPVFFYGQAYMLGVEAWLAAPLFLLLGPTITALKLPLLTINVTVALLLMAMFRRELGLNAVRAAIAVLPFALPSVGLSALLMDSNGGNVEPFLYVTLIWLLRARPVLCGLVFAVGFLNREFTVYGLAALAVLDAFDRTLLTRTGARRWAQMLGVAALTWLSIQGLHRLSSAAGPGTTWRDTLTASNNLAELAARTCVSPASAVAGAGRLLSIHWPALLGTAPYPLTAFSIESTGSQGVAGTSWLPIVIVLLLAVGIVTGAPVERTPASSRVAPYLVLVGAFSVAGYLFGRCGEVNFYAARYELLSVLGLVGLTAWFLSVRPAPAVQVALAAAFASWMTIVAAPQVRFIAEYASGRAPVAAKHQLVSALQGQGVRYGRADYWLAYYIDFLTREHMIFAADAPQRILLYNRIVAEHAAEAVRLSRRRCDGGVQLVAGVYRCP